jgi:hypothetical protein
MRRILLATLLIVAALLGLTSAAAADTIACPVGWGSLERSNPALSGAPITNVRTGSHPCFDRVVIDVAGQPAGYTVAYVAQVTTEGQGAVLNVPGGARLQATINDPAYDANGTPTFNRAVGQSAASVVGFPTLRSVVWGGSFEGYSTMGVGTRARLPFRVFTLPGRVVIDVAHKW